MKSRIIKITKQIWICTTEEFIIVPKYEGVQYSFIKSLFWLWFGITIMEK